MSEELDIKDILKYIYQKRKILLYVLLISIVIGGFYTFVIKRPEYKIETKILINKADASIEDFVMSKDLLNGKKIEAYFDKSTKIIEVSTISSKKNIQQTYNDLNLYMQNLKLKLEETYKIETFNIIEKPQLPQKAYNTSYLKDIAISAVAGIVVFGGYIIIMLSMRGLTNSLEIEHITKINVLGKVLLENRKEKNQKISYNVKNKKNINEIKRIEANIEFNKENIKPKMILLTGTDTKVGTTYIVNNLASQYAKLYNKVLLIDTDIYLKSLTNFYNKNNESGITDAYKLKDIEETEKFVQKTEKENIFILPLGNKIIEEIFLQEEIKNILENIKRKYDVILIDSPSINNSIIPIQLSAISDATVLVMESGKTKQEQILQAKTTIENVGGKISGIVLNKEI